MAIMSTLIDIKTYLVSVLNFQRSGFAYCARNISASPASSASLQHFNGE